MASFYSVSPFQASLQKNCFKQLKNLLPSLSGKRNYLIKKEDKYASTKKNRSISLPVGIKGCRNFPVRTNTSDFFGEVTPGIACTSDAFLDHNIDDKARIEEGNRNKGPSWIQTNIPRTARPYAYLVRLDKISAGPWLFSLPCLWAIALTAEAGTIPDVKIMAFFTLVMFITRGIACTINDYFDRDIDAKVERTKLRPLASGELTPFQGLCFLGLQVLSCYGLLLRVNDLRPMKIDGASAAVKSPSLAGILPQAYLGLAINSLPLCCWAAVKGSLDAHVLVPLCFSGLCWTLVYETIYSHQDKKDDGEIGVKSPALLLRDSTKIWTTAFAAACVGGFSITGLNASIGWPYYVFLAAASSHFAWQIWSVNLDSPADCFRKFESNAQFGAIIFCGILLGRLFQ